MLELSPTAEPFRAMAAAADHSRHTPSSFFNELEQLVADLEASFLQSERTLTLHNTQDMSSSLRIEKENRQRLLQKISLLVSAQKKLMREDSVSDNTVDGSRLSPKGLDSSQQDWKFNALLRMKKFLRKQYRTKKNRMMEFISKPSTPSEDIESERSQLMQLATDIKSIDFEIRLLSNSKTVVQDKGRPVEHELSSEYKGLTSEDAATGGKVLDGIIGQKSALKAVRRNLLDLYKDDGTQDQPAAQDADPHHEQQDARGSEQVEAISGSPKPAPAALEADSSLESQGKEADKAEGHKIPPAGEILSDHLDLDVEEVDWQAEGDRGAKEDKDPTSQRFDILDSKLDDPASKKLVTTLQKILYMLVMVCPSMSECVWFRSGPREGRASKVHTLPSFSCGSENQNLQVDEVASMASDCAICLSCSSDDHNKQDRLDVDEVGLILEDMGAQDMISIDNVDSIQHDLSGQLWYSPQRGQSNESFIEGNSLLCDFEEMPIPQVGRSNGELEARSLPVDLQESQAEVVSYVDCPTPTGEPSEKVNKALLLAFDDCLQAEKTKETSDPVVRTLFGAFDACVEVKANEAVESKSLKQETPAPDQQKAEEKKSNSSRSSERSPTVSSARNRLRRPNSANERDKTLNREEVQEDSKNIKSGVPHRASPSSSPPGAHKSAKNPRAVILSPLQKHQLNNKVDLMASMRLARKGTGMHVVQARQYPGQEDAESEHGSACQSETGVCSNQSEVESKCSSRVSDSFQLKIGGKRVLPPRVNGQGVTSKQLCRAPPLPDAEAPGKPGQFLPLPKLGAGDRVMEEGDKGKDAVNEEVLDALREAAVEKLKIYRKV
ncbi:hypothetical protein GUITHDRAFT_108407 [Guillardia theta CCMP2712]|uniref:Uncharacterized protein n=1 Tax=Guillardia theta (strain CCMP2712) TaxID=905079 RepID=L1JAG0_GUITC|nr:hypothetical protein GUITHDRAFT_108407 [Guillardia theta CCMP2712]EKX45533.1 hypothetical protein GUITHDRAFT_108407 [Guillardia theta CCMP2712]|eukprot:XP_005832513.1 hypothetical protein GUITHDRAFT_108407 [Guillardia theta CCMP2712]